MAGLRFKKGFTFMETLFTVAIFSVITTVIFSVFMVGVSSWQIGEAKTQSQEGSRRAMEMIAKELRLASSYRLQILNDSGAPVFSGTRIIFQVPVYSQQQIQLDTSGQLTWGAGGTQGYWVSYRLIIPHEATAGQLKRIILASNKTTEISSAVLANNVAGVEFNGLPNNTYTPSSIEIILTKRGIDREANRNTILKSRIWLRN